MVYKVKLISLWNSIIVLAGSLSVFFWLLFRFLPQRSIATIVIDLVYSAVSFGITYLLWQWLVTGRSVWTIDDKGVAITWTKPFAFFGSRDRNLTWEEIAKVSQNPWDTKYYDLKIRLVSGKTLWYFHDNLTTKDDFNAMLRDLYGKAVKSQKYHPKRGS